MSSKRDYYESLVVSKTATERTSNARTGSWPSSFTPTKSGDHSAEEKFKELGGGYDVLMDEQSGPLTTALGH